MTSLSNLADGGLSQITARYFVSDFDFDHRHTIIARTARDKVVIPARQPAGIEAACANLVEKVRAPSYDTIQRKIPRRP